MQNDGLIIRNEAGAILAVTLCNEKSRGKTVEQGELWVVDPTTGRVLPFAGGGKAVTGAVHHGDWYETTLRDRSAAAGGDDGTDGDGDGDHGADGTGIGLGTGVGAPEEPVRPVDPTGSGPLLHHTPPEKTKETGTVLAELTGIIAERHRTMPEGSYTTHLFTKGSSKIRKKTGEEAVELILAETRDELTSEAADLIYHLMVLLEAESLTIGDVIEVLAKRF
jgi:phosphoribosyl-AMP cyclohydrolase / phosphoribosyl-ATP pyrophosphohydrolase